MKNNIILLCLMGILLCNIHVNAQYFQNRFNKDLSRSTYSPDVLNDGICTKYNYANGNPSQYYQVGTGVNIVSYVTTGDSSYNRMRFVRTGISGVVTQNYSYGFSNSSENKMLHSAGLSICEIPGAGGNTGYIVVGSVQNNSTTGTFVPGGKDALITRITNNGTAKNSFRIRFKINGSQEELTCVIPSKTNPGNFYACGTAEYAANSKLMVVSFTSTGHINWASAYHFDDNNPTIYTNKCEGFAMAEDSVDGYLYVAGRYENGTTMDALLLKINPSTHGIDWAQNHDLGSSEKYTNIKIDHDRKILLCGETNSSNPQLVFSRFLTDGTLDLVRMYNIGESSSGRDILERKNTTGGYEYYIAIELVLSANHLNGICKIDAGGNLIHCAPYAPLAPLNYKYMGLDTVPSSTAGGLSLFSQKLVDGTYCDSYNMKSYFNGATCPDVCAVLPGTTITPVLIKQYLEDSDITNYGTTRLNARKEIFQQATDCNQSSISCGSSARAGSEEVSTPELKIEISPNPVADMAHLRIAGFVIPAEIMVHSSDGRLVHILSINEESTVYDLTYNTSDLTPGLYHLTVHSQQKIKSVSFIKR